MARLIIKKYKNTNDKSAAFGKTYGRLVHQDTMNTSDLWDGSNTPTIYQDHPLNFNLSFGLRFNLK